MTSRVLKPLPLTAERFAPFGDVIAAGPHASDSMNDARFERFGELATVDVAGDVAIGIVRSRSATSLPYHVDIVERHPLGSQAFIPLAEFEFLVVVARPGEAVAAADLQAFVTNGRQGVNYHRGTWHMPLIALGAGQQFLVVDRAAAQDNCEERALDTAVILDDDR